MNPAYLRPSATSGAWWGRARATPTGATRGRLQQQPGAPGAPGASEHLNQHVQLDRNHPSNSREPPEHGGVEATENLKFSREGNHQGRGGKVDRVGWKGRAQRGTSFGRSHGGGGDWSPPERSGDGGGDFQLRESKGSKERERWERVNRPVRSNQRGST
jgi:hypothetical protein